MTHGVPLLSKNQSEDQRNTPLPAAAADDVVGARESLGRDKTVKIDPAEVIHHVDVKESYQANAGLSETREVRAFGQVIGHSDSARFSREQRLRKTGAEPFAEGRVL